VIWTILAILFSGKTTDKIVTHGLAAGAGFLVGRATAPTTQVVTSPTIVSDVIYSSTANVCRCDDLYHRSGCYFGPGYETPVSERAFLILSCGAPRTVRITKRTWTPSGLFMEWVER